MKLKRLIILMLIFICTICTFGCKNADSVVDNTVITVNGVSISLEEAKFYAYNKQANYEVYYYVSGSDIQWDEPYYDDNEATLEELVKAEVIEQIKESVVVCEYAKEQGIQLSDEDQDQIKDMADEFLADSKKELLDKMDISRDKLITIYTRQMYCDKLYEKMEIAEDEDSQGDLYKELIDAVETSISSDLWDDITFEDAIFTKDDVEPYPE